MLVFSTGAGPQQQNKTKTGSVSPADTKQDIQFFTQAKIMMNTDRSDPNSDIPQSVPR